ERGVDGQVLGLEVARVVAPRQLLAHQVHVVRRLGSVHRGGLDLQGLGQGRLRGGGGDEPGVGHGPQGLVAGRGGGLGGLGDWIIPASRADSTRVRLPTSLWKYMRAASPTPWMLKDPTWPR